MSRSAKASKTIPVRAIVALETLGMNLRIARERRGESLREWTKRMDVSVPTLRRMEAGDPTVGAGVYATAIWLCQATSALAAVASPETDSEATELDIIRASRIRRR